MSFEHSDTASPPGGLTVSLNVSPGLDDASIGLGGSYVYERGMFVPERKRDHRPRLVAFARVFLLPTSEGGRASPTPPGQFSCVLRFGSELRDCRLDFGGRRRVAPGETAFARLRFLDPAALGARRLGERFDVLDGGVVGHGVIVAAG